MPLLSVPAGENCPERKDSAFTQKPVAQRCVAGKVSVGCERGVQASAAHPDNTGPTTVICYRAAWGMEKFGCWL